VLYPETGFTKAQALDYYARIAHVLLPHLHGRPMTLKRYPEGVNGPHFYDKHCEGAPPWVEVAPVWSTRKGDEIRFCRLEDRASLLWSVNRGNIEMHPLLSVMPEPDTPTTLVFDLDPGPPAGILDAAALALILRDMLEALQLQSWAKSSGAHGVHVYVPLNAPVTFEASKRFARRVAETLAGRLPERAIARTDKRARRGLVLVDWGQNDRHKSTVAVYSLRAKLQRPTVSAPLRWDELRDAIEARDEQALLLSPHAVLERVASDGDLFAPVLELVQEPPS
jgi:bifunctional non-homologous end joining protein LigD